MRGLRDKIAIVAGAAPGNIGGARERSNLHADADVGASGRELGT